MLMVVPEQPGANQGQVLAANEAQAAAIKAGEKPAEPGLAPHYPAIKGQNLRGFGWDIDTGYSKPRGVIFPIGSFGHTGFTGTSLWMDPASDTYVILLANAIHPRGNPPISNLRGQVATAAAQALGLGGPSQQVSDSERRAKRAALKDELNSEPMGCDWACPTLTGIDVLEFTHFAALANLHHIGLFTNQSGVDAQGRRTIDVLTTNHVPLTTIFTPEHGLSAQQDTTQQLAERDEATHLPVISLYGAHELDRRPRHEQLKDLDAVVIDLQDAGVRFWTYEAAVGYLLEAAAMEKIDYRHELEIILLDRPNPVGGVAVEGPVSDAGAESYVNAMPLPVRHGLTLGELARYMVVAKRLDARLTVIPMQHWSRSEYFADTGLAWVNPSPNLRSPEAAVLYPALGLVEYNNLSVGRGTDHPFSFFGAGVPPTKPSTSTTTGGLTDTTSSTTTPWFHATEVASYLTARHIPGVTFTSTTEAITEDANHYPYHGQTIEAVRLTLTDPRIVDTPELGIEILAALHHLYPTQFNLPRAMPLVGNRATMDALTRGEDPRSIAAKWQADLVAFRAGVKAYLLYP
jgi:uncharacterized protein YbbC (DUF1343 family)